MRFITEFELLSPFEIKNYKSLRERGCAEWLGLDIARAFGWQQKGETTPRGQVSERHTLEIEAFPMDKWVEFKKRLFFKIEESQQYDGPISGVEILELIKELESFGKPAGAAKET